jgi:hypothetical protein
MHQVHHSWLAGQWNGRLLWTILAIQAPWRDVTELAIALYALAMPSFTHATREKEDNALFEYAWNVRWSLSAIVSFHVNEVHQHRLNGLKIHPRLTW